jgi:hypothetical protein
LSGRLIAESGFDREMSEAHARKQAEALLPAVFQRDRLAQLYAIGAKLGVYEAADAAISP